VIIELQCPDTWPEPLASYLAKHHTALGDLELSAGMHTTHMQNSSIRGNVQMCLWAKALFS
jgi:hypothetical protein